MEGRIDKMEERIATVHGEIATVKGDLQRMGPLEIKVDAMLEKLLLLERMDQLLQKWEHSKKVSNPEEKKGIGTNLRGPHVGLVAAPQEESSMGEKSPQQIPFPKKFHARCCCQKQNREVELKR